LEGGGISKEKSKDLIEQQVSQKKPNNIDVSPTAGFKGEMS